MPFHSFTTSVITAKSYAKTFLKTLDATFEKRTTTGIIVQIWSEFPSFPVLFFTVTRWNISALPRYSLSWFWWEASASIWVLCVSMVGFLKGNISLQLRLLTVEKVVLCLLCFSPSMTDVQWCEKSQKNSLLWFWETDNHIWRLPHFSAAPLLENNIRMWRSVIWDRPLTLRITSSTTQVTLQPPANLMVLKCFRVRPSSNICHLMGSFHSKSLIVPWACMYFQHTRPRRESNLNPGFVKAGLWPWSYTAAVFYTNMVQKCMWKHSLCFVSVGAVLCHCKGLFGWNYWNFGRNR